MMTGCSSTIPPPPKNPQPKPLNPQRLNPKRLKEGEMKCCRLIVEPLNLPEPPKDRAAPKAKWGKVKVTPITSIKPKIIGLVLLPGGRISFFLQGTYNALVGKASRPLINPVLSQTQGRAVITVKLSPVQPHVQPKQADQNNGDDQHS